MSYFFSLLFSLISAGTNTAWAASFKTCADFQVKGSFKNESAKLDALMKHHWNYNMQEYPEWATYAGIPGHNDRWTDVSIEAKNRREKNVVCLIESLKTIQVKKLSKPAKLNYELLLQSYQDSLESQQFDGEFLVLNAMDGVHTSIADVLSAGPKNNKKDIQDLLSRLESAAQVVDQHLALLVEGLKRGVTPPQVTLKKVPDQFKGVLTADPKESVLYEPFKDLPAFMSAEEKTDVQKKALDLVQNKLYPRLEAYRKFVVDEYIPKARMSIAQTALPKGEAWYRFSVREQTTTSLTPEQIHQLGLSEVERIEKEMVKIKDQVGFKGDLKKFNEYLLKDKKFFFSTSKELMMTYRDIAKRADAELPKLFGLLPRLPYGIRELPAYKGPSASAGYYMGGSLEAGRAGYVEMNVYDLASRPSWSLEALTLHEGVPGHHLQIALAQEMGELPDFRKFGGYTAYSEGWGLYAESLGEMMNMYQDPYSMYGRYTYEMWRAVRLVVDTGMHSKGWTRDQAIQYFTDHLAKSKLEAEVEIDRYISWAGQALAYKIGQLKFLELREKAKGELKEAFDIRKFHDEVLSHGAIPLNVLDKMFAQWLDEQKQADPRVKKN